MDARMQISLNQELISPICSFTQRWGMDCGLTHEDALQLTVAVSEIISDIIQFAYPQDIRGHLELSFHHTYSNVEVVLSELGQPFDPDRHRYDPEAARRNGDFDGAGLRLIHRFSDEFLYINKGREGKEFRISKRVKVHLLDRILERSRSHISSELASAEEATNKEPLTFSIDVVEPPDSEDIARLIYSAYEHSYTKDDLYFPKKIEKTRWGKEKLGVIARKQDGEAVGYFAIQIKEDSNIGEVREAVVAPRFRRQGIMSRMMEELIELAQENELAALFGIAVTVHPVSQKVNAKYGFKSTALMLAASKNPSFKGFVEDYPQPGSLVIDFLPIAEHEKKKIYLPDRYRDIIEETYELLELPVEIDRMNAVLAERSSINIQINYTSATSLIIVDKYGSDFRTVLSDMIKSLEKQKELHAIFLDIPLENEATPEQWIQIEDLGFIYCGLVPLFHEESDYLRMQKIYYDLDLDLIEVYSDFGKKIKSLISDEYHRDRQTG